MVVYTQLQKLVKTYCDYRDMKMEIGRIQLLLMCISSDDDEDNEKESNTVRRSNGNRELQELSSNLSLHKKQLRRIVNRVCRLMRSRSYICGKQNTLPMHLKHYLDHKYEQFARSEYEKHVNSGKSIWRSR
jgi:hypothetical protein